MIPNRFDAKLDLLSEELPPDFYNAPAGQRPQDDFIVSRHHDGSVASRYGDVKWNISAWDAEGRRSFVSFDFWGGRTLTPAQNFLTLDARWLVFGLVWLRDGATFSVGTLLNYMGVISTLVLYADEFSCSIPDLLSDENRLLAFAGTHCSGNRTKLLSALLSNLIGIGETLMGFPIIGDKARNVLSLRSTDYKTNLKQHPPIPTAIYSTILSVLAEELTAWDLVAAECLALMRVCGRDLYYGRNYGTQQPKAKREVSEVEWTPRPEWADVASPRVRAYLVERGLADSVSGLGSMVALIQLVAKLTIQAFSGMRDDEARSLPYDCPKTTASGNRTHLLIHGRTTKLAKGRKRVLWVTNQAGHKAIKIAQQIADAIYYACGAVLITKKNSKIEGNRRPLFVAAAYLGFTGRTRKFLPGGRLFTSSLALDQLKRVRGLLQPVIKESDIRELEQIDEHRAWSSESKYQVGNPWVFTTHQLRRSLALYAQRSGLVSIPSLRRQLQHITDEMARYYSRGSHYAKDVFGDGGPHPDHFGLEWQSAQVESAALSYAVNVLLSDDTLFGGHAAFVAHRLQGDSGTVSAETRVETVRMFKKGLLSYRETLIGGCTRSEQCDSPALDWLNLECIQNNCSNMVGSIKKLESVVAEQSRLVQSLSPTSLLYRTENFNLGVLVSARDKARLQNGIVK